jgi:WD40 repeat protein
LVAATLDGRVQVMRALEGDPATPPVTLAEHPGGALAIEVSPDGRRVASGGQDGAVRIASLADGTPPIKVDVGGGWVEHVRWAPSGRWLAAGAGRRVRFFRADGGLGREPLDHKSAVTALFWDASGSTVTTASQDGLRLMRPGRRRPLADVPWKGGGPILAACESPDRRHVAMGHVGGMASVIHMSTGRVFEYGGFAGKVRQLGWSANGKLLAIASGDEVAVFPFTTRGPVHGKERLLGGHRARICGLTFAQHAGREFLVSADEDGLLLLRTGGPDFRKIASLMLGARLDGLVVAPTGTKAAVTVRGGDLLVIGLAGDAA